MAFARKARADRGGGPVNFSSPALGVFNESQSMYISKRHIEAANPAELEEMEAQMKEVSEIIRAEKRKRSGDDTVAQHGSTTMLERSHDPSAEAPDAQAQQQPELTTVEEASEVDNDLDAPTVVEADYIHDGASAAEITQASKIEEPVKTVDHATTSPRIEDAASKPPADATIKPTDITNQPVALIGDKEGVETDMDSNAIVTGLPEEAVDEDANAALTPVSDSIKEANELSSVKPTKNGMETPETNIPDQTTSPIEAGRMDLD